MIKCRRIQLGCAITIHKSQGGMFDKIVYKCDKSLQNQPIYVALSRVASLDGLYMTNTRNDFKFYNRFGQASPTVRDVRDGCQRLVLYPSPTLKTLVAKVKKFCDSVPDQRLILITAINAEAWSRTQKTSLPIPSSTDLIICQSVRFGWKIPCK
ncbi:ATP-dependent DNA helicase [Trichonephila clavipes]|nr:ATP-dependent DNA helicase [Trichonephila clavipes]